MKKLLTTITTAATTLALAAPAFAATDSNGVSVNPCTSTAGAKGGTNFNGLCSLNANNIGTIIQTAVTVLLVGAVLISLFFLIWGGIRWITSGGDKGKVEGARNTIVSAIIGLVIAFLAYFILQLVLSIFGISLTDLKLPQLANSASSQ